MTPLFDPSCLRLYGVTDTRWLGGGLLREQVAEAIEGGVTAIQYREKNAAGRTSGELALVRDLSALCRRRGVPLIVNDNLKLALDSGAAGLHIGQGDLNAGEAARQLAPGMFLGVSVSTVREALNAEASGANYLGVGAVFPTATKADAPEVSRETMEAICRAVRIPVVAIGGISERTVPLLALSGIAGVAAISALFAEPERVRENASRLRAAVDAANFGTLRPLAALTIAGSDPVGGAGIQGDLKTFAAHGFYGMGAVTSVIAQNTFRVGSSSPVPAALLEEQLEAVFQDIPPDGIKIGLVPRRESALAIARVLDRYPPRVVVADPVVFASSGEQLGAAAAEHREAFLTVIARRATVITPNLAEAALLWGRPVASRSDMARAAAEIRDRMGGKGSVLVKGGHLGPSEAAADCLASAEGIAWFEELRVPAPAARGTGCALSSALAANLGRGMPIDLAIRRAKGYLARAIEGQYNLGRAQHPLAHLF